MQKETKNTEVTEAELVLTPQIDKIKLIARDALRMELISPRLTKISVLEAAIKEAKEYQELVKKDIEVIEYEFTKEDTNHPRYNEKDSTENKEIRIKNKNEMLEEYSALIKGYEEKIENQREGIRKIEAGKTLVSSAELSNLVEVLIEQDSKNKLTQ